MEFQDVVRRRRMVRNYDPRPVDPAVIDRALANATRAPSAGFSQGWGFLVLDERADVDRFWAATSDPAPDSAREPDRWLRGMQQAPVIVIPCSSQAAYLDRYAEPDKGWTDRDENRWPVPYWHIDAGMASLLILQTAVDEGLGACFFGIPGPREAAVREAFGIPDRFDPIGAITIGHPTTEAGALGSPSRRRRTPVDQVVHRGAWSASADERPDLA
jgi:nitroreductase